MDDKASAVTAALTARTIMSTFLTTGDYTTDLITTFPTRYTKVSDNDTDPVRAPFTTSETANTGAACHELIMDYMNREEGYSTFYTDVGVMGPPSPRYKLCYEVNVQAINDVGSVESFSKATDSKAVRFDAPLGSQFTEGWTSIDLSAYTVTPTAGSVPEVVTGLPVVGFTAVADMVLGTERGGVFPSRILVDEQ
jgi:hypothetical protein